MFFFARRNAASNGTITRLCSPEGFHAESAFKVGSFTGQISLTTFPTNGGHIFSSFHLYRAVPPTFLSLYFTSTSFHNAHHLYCCHPRFSGCRHHVNRVSRPGETHHWRRPRIKGRDAIHRTAREQTKPLYRFSHRTTDYHDW